YTPSPSASAIAWITNQLSPFAGQFVHSVGVALGSGAVIAVPAAPAVTMKPNSVDPRPVGLSSFHRQSSVSGMGTPHAPELKNARFVRAVGIAGYQFPVRVTFRYVRFSARHRSCAARMLWIIASASDVLEPKMRERNEAMPIVARTLTMTTTTINSTSVKARSPA